MYTIVLYNVYLFETKYTTI